LSHDAIDWFAVESTGHKSIGRCTPRQYQRIVNSIN